MKEACRKFSDAEPFPQVSKVCRTSTYTKSMKTPNSFIEPAALQLLLSISVVCNLEPVLGVPSQEIVRANVPWGYGNNSGGGYLGPDYWTNLPGGTSCGGSRQSPINFVTMSATRRNYEKDRLFFDKHGKSPIDEKWTFVNNGHSVQLTTFYKAGERPELQQNSLNGIYVFDQVHFHWGSDDKFGSEHLVDGSAAVLELHIVHSLRNASNEEINQRRDGLAVIGILFEIGNFDNPKLESFVRNLERVAQPGSSINNAVLAGHTLKDLIPSNKTFFRYMGSLTTPPCTENVVWTVFTQKQKISLDQLAVFRTVLANNELEHNATVSPVPVSDNYRPPQPLNGREVFLFVDGASSLSICQKLLALITLLDSVINLLYSRKVFGSSI
ncbi:hypothetical protein RvY_17267 [Ramazzottius varieornatus]|uniref:carbonic anhydrase n=1 Tax=Ramazzottius varieornatus TaxID=947166 RepID=A0A1D1W3U6_RAMVA|nr:hypothetical protein RvY_17267 [Ramazzottius varieornatus]